MYFFSFRWNKERQRKKTVLLFVLVVMILYDSKCLYVLSSVFLKPLLGRNDLLSSCLLKTFWLSVKISPTIWCLLVCHFLIFNMFFFMFICFATYRCCHPFYQLSIKLFKIYNFMVLFHKIYRFDFWILFLKINNYIFSIQAIL